MRLGLLLEELYAFKITWQTVLHKVSCEKLGKEVLPSFLIFFLEINHCLLYIGTMIRVSKHLLGYSLSEIMFIVMLSFCLFSSYKLTDRWNTWPVISVMLSYVHLVYFFSYPVTTPVSLPLKITGLIQISVFPFSTCHLGEGPLCSTFGQLMSCTWEWPDGALHLWSL